MKWCRGTEREKHVQHLGQFVAIAFGKPDAKYNFSKEGVDNLTKAHANMGITAKDFDIVASHLQGCMEVRLHQASCFPGRSGFPASFHVVVG